MLLYQWLLIEKQELEADIKEKKQQQAILLVNKRELEEEMAQLVKSTTEVECLVADMRSNQSQGVNQRSSLQKQLKKIQQNIQAKEVELMEIEPQWDAARNQERETRQTLVLQCLLALLLTQVA